MIMSVLFGEKIIWDFSTLSRLMIQLLKVILQ